MIYLSACPLGGNTWTEIQIEGEDEEVIAAMLLSVLDRLDWEVEQEDADE